jgi:hypothetical protein
MSMANVLATMGRWTNTRRNPAAQKGIGRFLRCAVFGALALATVASGQTTLTKGDLAIVGYATDSTDGAWVVNLIPIEAGTSINLTQNACQSDGSFSTSENSNNKTHTFSTATPAGTITSIPWDGMSNDGDQVFIYQGTLSQANLICALSSSPWITSGSTTAQTSYRPSGLTEGTHYAAFASELDNGYVTDLSGSRTPAEWLAYIHVAANWTRNNTRPGDGSYPSGTITVATGGTPSPTVAITDPATDPLTVPNATASRGVAGTSANAVGLLTWSNALTTDSGEVAVGATWSVSAIGLNVGANLITVTATNAAGTAASDTVTITREAALVPSLTVTTPAGKSATVDFATDSYNLMGTAANLAGSIVWSNALNDVTGTLAAGDSWSFTAGLDVGVNAITISGTNINGVAASDSATITRAAQTLGISPGNVLVYCVDGNGAALGSDGTVVKVMEFAAADGSLVQTLTMPSGASGTRLTASGTATSEGKLTVSPNGAYAALVGYDAAENAASVKSTLNRTIARITLADGSVNLATTGLLGGNDNTRGVAVADSGSDFWLAAAGATGTSDTGRGPRYLSLGQITVGAQLANINIRGCRIFGGQLYEYGDATGNYGVYAVGSGLPTSGSPTRSRSRV